MRERRLIFIRAIWWIATSLVLVFIAVGVHDRYAQLSSVSPIANTLESFECYGTTADQVG